MTRLLASLTLALTLGLAAAGCSDRDRNGAFTGSGGQNVPASTPSVPAGAPGPGASPAEGIVTALTGDPDNEVSDEVELLVFRANQLGESDDPLDF